MRVYYWSKSPSTRLRALKHFHDAWETTQTDFDLNTKKLFGYLILGFALTEAVALLGLMVSMVILFSKG